MGETLTLQEALALAKVIEMAQGGHRVQWLDGNTPSGVQEGTARHICHDDSTFITADEEVRDAYLRITLTSGFDYYMPVRTAMRKVIKHEMRIDA